MEYVCILLFNIALESIVTSLLAAITYVAVQKPAAVRQLPSVRLSFEQFRHNTKGISPLMFNKSKFVE